MSARTPSARPWLAAAALALLPAGPAAAQPPSPLELARGLRDNGQVDLALEYLKELDGKPLAPDDKAALPLERAKCLLEASGDEPDEGTRLGMIAQAKEGLDAFVRAHPNHPRAVEGLLSIAKLTSLDAREVLARARKMDIPPPGGDAEERKAREQAQARQAAEAAKARPLFQLAATRFAAASKRLRERLADGALDYATRRALEREAFEAELASGINQFSIAETYIPVEDLKIDQQKERNKFLEQAKETFGKLAQGPDASRTKWVALAWVAEVTYEQTDKKGAEAEIKKVKDAGVAEAADGKRLASFFQLRRNVREALGSGAAANIGASVREMEAWLDQYGGGRRPTPEVFAVRYFLARTLHYQADALTPRPKGAEAPKVPPAAQALYERAERLYRQLAQTDHEYTTRAVKYRTAAVRRLLGDADQNPLSYATFEKAQMASLIQVGKLLAAEDKQERLAADGSPDGKQLEAARAEARQARERVIALLERARDLAGPQDPAADVADVLLRLIYFYGQNDQHLQAAVLGEHVARTVRTTGGKSALAGLLGLNGYLAASRAVKGDSPDVAAAARQADRDRAAALARFLDERFPNDNATDAARLRLAALLTEDKKLLAAYDVLGKVRPSFPQLTSARLLQGFVVQQLVAPRDAPLPPADKLRLFRKATADLRRVPKPAPVADEDEVRGYLQARCRLASLMLAQDRADPETEARDAGFNQALALSTEVLAEIPGFECMADGGKKLTADGLEMHYTALDLNTRAQWLRALAMTRNGQFDGALELIKPTVDAVAAGGPLLTPEVRAGAGSGDPQKARIAKLAGDVDRGRVDVILAGFRARVRQGNAGEAAKLLDLMVKAGGTVEDSLPVLEPVGRELAALMLAAQKAGKADEAKNLGAGLGVLLNKLRAVKDLPVPTRLFIGRTLQSIGQHAEALETLKAVPAPAVPGWDTKRPDEFPPEQRGQVQSQVRDHALAVLTRAKAHTGLKQFAEAEKLLRDALGDNARPGWGAGRLYFRQALAENHEGKGAAEPDPRKANGEWGLAVREWTTLVNLQRGQLARLPPVGREVGAEAIDRSVQFAHQLMAPVGWFHGPIDQALQVPAARVAFADAFFDLQRCLLTANQQLLKDPAQAPRLQKTYESVGKQFAEIEKQFPAADWPAELHNRYHEFLKASEPLRAAYGAAGGKMFLVEKRPE